MTALAWDQVGERVFETGIDRGVLYIGDSAVVWNGLTDLDENSTREVTSYWLDGVKYLDHQTPNEFSATLKAFTYPEEFEQVLGVQEYGIGFFLADQPGITFGLAYRTLVGNDVDGTDLGYKIHLIYNVTASPDVASFASVADPATPTEFSWSLLATPVTVPGFRPTAHFILDSRTIDSDLLILIEETLYGTDSIDPALPSIDDLITLIDSAETIYITDNGDGTWTASNDSDYIIMTDATTFEIINVDATYSDANTYTVSTTIPS